MRVAFAVAYFESATVRVENSPRRAGPSTVNRAALFFEGPSAGSVIPSKSNTDSKL